MLKIWNFSPFRYPFCIIEIILIPSKDCRSKTFFLFSRRLLFPREYIYDKNTLSSGHCQNYASPGNLGNLFTFSRQQNFVISHCFKLSENDTFIVKIGWRSFMMSFRMSLMVKLAPKNTLLLIMLIYIDIGGNEHLNKFKSNLGRGSPTIWAMPERKGVFFRQCLPFNGWTCSPQKVGEP